MSDNINTNNGNDTLITIDVEASGPQVIDVAIPGGGGFVNLKPYATKLDTYTKAEVDSKVQAVTPDLSTYATKAEVEAKVSTVTGQKGDPGPKGDKGDPFTYADFTPDQLAALKGPKGDPGPQGPQGPAGVGGSGGGSVDLSQYAKKADLNAYLTRTDANNNYAQKGWSAQTFAYKGDLGAFIRKNEIGQYALTPGDAASRYVNNIQAQSFAKTADLSKYRTVADGDNLYLKKVNLNNYLQMLGDPRYLQKADASTNYVAKADYQAQGDKLKQFLTDKKLTINSTDLVGILIELFESVGRDQGWFNDKEHHDGGGTPQPPAPPSL